MAGNTMVPPPAYAVAAAAAQVLLSRRRKPAGPSGPTGLSRVSGRSRLSRFSGPSGLARVSGLSGLAVAVGSASLAIAADRLFRERGTTDHPFHPEEATVLVTVGPFAFTRNPMYVGLTGILIGHAIARRSALALLPIVAFLVAVDRLQITAEEQALSTKFGPEYDAYRARVPRWLGRVGG